MELSKHERKKLLRQQAKEQQNQDRSRSSRKNLTKNIMLFGIIGLVVLGIGWYIFSASTVTWPTADDDPILGNPEGQLTIIEFGDYKCPFTKQFNQGILGELLDEYGDRVKFVYRDMPTGKHGDSRTPARAADCAADQGKFKEYHDLLFRNQEASRTKLVSMARDLGMDIDQFNACFESSESRDEVNKDYLDGRDAVVTQTPTLFIGESIRLDGLYSKQAYVDAIEWALENQ